MGKQWKQWETIFLGSKITAGGYCSHEIKRCLLLGRKAMTNLGSILKSRDICNKGPSSHICGFSSSNVWIWELDHIESWAPKNWCFWTVVLEKILECPFDCKEIQPVHPKGNQIWIFTGRTDAEAETPIRWPPDAKNWLIGKDWDAEKDWRWEEKGMTGWDGWMASLNGLESEQTLGAGDGQGILACCSPWSCIGLNITEQLNWWKLMKAWGVNENSSKMCLWVYLFMHSISPWITFFLF